MRGLNLFARAALVMAVEDRQSLSPAVRTGLLAPYDNWANRIAIDRFVKDIPLSKRHRTWAVLDQIERDLKSLADLPIRLIWGMKDWCFRPSCLDRFLTHWPQAEIDRYEQAGHYVVEEAWREFLPSLRGFFGAYRRQRGSSMTAPSLSTGPVCNPRLPARSDPTQSGQRPSRRRF
jgi:pimeloyl-ACP methyl ester carboxylesterase